MSFIEQHNEYPKFACIAGINLGTKAALAINLKMNCCNGTIQIELPNFSVSIGDS